MIFFLETTNSDLFGALIKNNQVIDGFHIEKLQKKADQLPQLFETTLARQNIQVSEIQNWYVTSGPGSFMGSRLGLLFVQTICQITKAKLHVGLTFELFGRETESFIEINGHESAKGFFDGKSWQVEIISKQPSSIINYEAFQQNPGAILCNFREVKPLQAQATYFKEQQIGGR